MSAHARLVLWIVLGMAAGAACLCVWLDAWLNGDHGDEGEED